MEAEIVLRPTNQFSLELAGALLDAKYRDYRAADPARPALGEINLDGNRLNQAPTYSLNLAVNYRIPVGGGDVDLRAEGHWPGKYYFSAFNLDHVSQPAYAQFNAFATWSVNNFSVSAFVRNITNKRVLAAKFVTTTILGAPVAGSFQPPRTYGVTLGYKFQ